MFWRGDASLGSCAGTACARWPTPWREAPGRDHTVAAMGARGRRLHRALVRREATAHHRGAQRVAPDTPVFLLHLYDRALLNGAALRAVGHTKDTPSPPGGEIVHDGAGNPSGLLLAHRKRSPPSCAKLLRKFGEGRGDDILPRIGLWIGRPFGAPFVGPPHEGRSVAAGLGGIEIEIMASHHAAFAGIELKELGAGLIGCGQDLVLADRFTGNVKETHMNLPRSRASESGKSGQHFRLWIASHHNVRRSSLVNAASPLLAST
jgi:hypothetical protein